MDNGSSVIFVMWLFVMYLLILYLITSKVVIFSLGQFQKLLFLEGPSKYLWSLTDFLAKN